VLRHLVEHYRAVLTMEVFSEEDFNGSLAALTESLEGE